MVTMIKVSDYINACNTNEDGTIIKNEILKRNEKVILSFENLNNVTSSFVNSLFVELKYEKGLNFIKSNIIIKDTNTQINKLIKDRLLNEKSKTLINY